MGLTTIPNLPVAFGLTADDCVSLQKEIPQLIQEGDCTQIQLKQDICKTVILDTDFDCNDATGWTLGTGWTIFNNKLIASLPTGVATYAGAFSIGSTYLIEFKYKSIVSAAVSMGDGSLSPMDANTSKTAGDKFLIRATTTDLVINPNAAAKGFFSSITIYEVPSNLVTDPNFFEPLASGTTDSTTASKLEDSTADFITDGIEAGMIVVNVTDTTYTFVSAVDDLNTLSLADDIFVSGEDYKIYKWETSGAGGVWQIAGGSAGGATHTSGTDPLWISAGLTPSTYYKIIFRISNLTAGNLTLRTEVCAAADIYDTYYANGHYEVVIKISDCATPAPSDYLMFVPSTDFDGTILYAAAFEMCDIIFGSGLIPEGDSTFTTPLYSGTTDGTSANQLVDSTAAFAVGAFGLNIVRNVTDSTNTEVQVFGFNAPTAIDIVDDIFVSGEAYEVWNWQNFSSVANGIFNGKLNFLPTGAGTFSTALAVSGFIQNQVYKVVFTISGRTAGFLNVQLGSNIHADSFTENKQHIIFIKYTGATGSSTIQFTQSVPATFDGSLDNVQIYPASFWVETEAGVFVDGIADVAVNPNGDKLAVTVNQNWDGYADGCYVIKGEDCCEVSEEITSNHFNVQATQDCSKLLKWYNDDNAFGVDFTTGYESSLRIPAQLINPTYDQDAEEFDDSAGENHITYGKSNKFWTLQIDFLQDYLHDALRLALIHDHLFIDGEEYTARPENYEPAWPSKQGARRYTKMNIEVRKKIENNINTSS